MSGTHRRVVVPLAVAGFCFLVLVALGVWQLYRLRWKEGILAQVAASEAAPPVRLTGSPPRFYRVIVRGHFLPGFSVLYGDSTRDGKVGLLIGADMLALLVRDHGRPILVDRGWVPVTGHAPPPPAGEVSVTGYVTNTESGGPFTPADNPAAGRVYARDPARIAREFHLPHPARIVLVAMGKAPPGPASRGSTTPIPARHLPRPPNNHLEYAMTWFALAVALVIITVQRMRKE